ncbi:MAG: heme exporter protein CcmD [Alphaproteobacteria bacterium]|uniref:heme exporter protein CcmD n=1 Tax=Brevundimonas sp. TaxID=1871086 RepID=UPI00185D5CD5|nr:heme exporter protein CcmD [Brevundimonas sp.]MBA3049261.1 heme exporter protein CcmD [Brevundimonas sp.]MBU3970325.1 heme exporter protein CcmD [Alphaproteobacteria bacterium]MBU3973267.1 heme exporter protein CcmD [Alphaproteobacteria bacterium]
MFDLDMGRYAAFVWPAWALSAVVLAGLSARALVAARRWSAELKRLEDEPNRAQAVQSTVAPRK